MKLQLYVLHLKDENNEIEYQFLRVFKFLKMFECVMCVNILHRKWIARYRGSIEGAQNQK